MDTTIDGLRLYYEHDGQGSDLVLIHGLGGSLHDWDSFIPDLARAHRVLRWDESDPLRACSGLQASSRRR